jgi:hypothetical protein
MLFPINILQCGNKFLNVQLLIHIVKKCHSLTYSVKAIDMVDKKILLVKSMTKTCKIRDSYKLSKKYR